MSFDDRLLMNLLLPVGLMLALYRLPVSVVAARWLVVGLLAGLTAYYATWRVTQTLPAFDWTPAALWPWTFFTFEGIALLYEGWCLYVLTGYTNRTPEADGYEAFREAGDPFDPAVAQRLLRFIYSSGNSLEPSQAYRAFRGRSATVAPMLRQRGLVESQGVCTP